MGTVWQEKHYSQREQHVQKSQTGKKFALCKTLRAGMSRTCEQGETSKVGAVGIQSYSAL